MKRYQVIVSLADGKWIIDYVTVKEGQTDQQAFDEYMNQYEHVRTQCGLDIIKKLLPSITHISKMSNF